MHLRVSARMSALLLAAGVVAAAAACGSSSTDNNAGSGATTTTAVTKASFVEQANAICKQMNADTKALGQPTSDAEAVQVMTQTATYVQSAVDKIKALPQPTEDSAALQSMYADITAVITLANQTASALNAGDMTQAQTYASQIDAANSKANASANAYGLTECGKDSSSSGSTTTTAKP